MVGSAVIRIDREYCSPFALVFHTSSSCELGRAWCWWLLVLGARAGRGLLATWVPLLGRGCWLQGCPCGAVGRATLRSLDRIIPKGPSYIYLYLRVYIHVGIHLYPMKTLVKDSCFQSRRKADSRGIRLELAWPKRQHPGAQQRRGQYPEGPGTSLVGPGTY